MRKFYIAIFIILGAWFVMPGRLTASSQTDSIKLITPSNNETVNGIVKVRWVTSGEQINSSRIYVSQGKCDENKIYFGDIKVFSQNLNATENRFYFEWDTTNPLLNALSLTQGEYCLTANAVYGHDGTRSVDDSINIKVDNASNIAPRILNNISTIFLNPTEQFTFDVDGADLNGDQLVYSISRGPNFLSINSANGLISTVNNLEVGIHSVVVEVNDNKGGKTDMPFVLNVLENSDNLKDQLKLTFITIDRIYSRKISLSWEWKDEPLSIGIQYSNNGFDWTDITTVESDKTSFEWDASALQSGEYYLRFIPKENLATLYAVLTPQIYIADLASSNDESPTLFNLSPKEGDVLTSSVSTITGEFTIPEGRSVSKLELTVNETIVVTNCTIQGTTFSCVLSTPLANGENKYLVKLIDNIGKEAIAEVKFTISTAAVTPTPQVAPVSNNFVFMLMLLICLIGVFIFAFIKFKDLISNKLKTVLKPKKKDDKKKKSEYEIEFENYNTSKETYKDPAYDPFSIGAGELGAPEVEPLEQATAKQKDQEVEDIGTQKIEDANPIEVTLPTSYSTDPEELPAWLQDVDDASDPVGIEPEELQGNKPLEGTQPFGMDDPIKN